jgi:RNA polymerase sigma factor (sigma-70 family)
MAPQPRAITTASIPSELIARVRSGSGEALAELYRRTAPGLAQLARRLTGSPEDAEDVLHDLFLGLPEALRQYEERGRVEQWLRRLTARLALTRIRARERRQELFDVSDGELASESPALDDRLSLEGALHALPDALRTVLVLKLVEGYSHAEIAALLDITTRASEQRVYRAIQLLRARLSADLRSSPDDIPS